MSTRLAVDLSLNIPLTTSTALRIPCSDSTHRLIGSVSYTNLKAVHKTVEERDLVRLLSRRRCTLGAETVREWRHDCLHHRARVLPSCREGS
ncbi:hypothetical protein FOMPIDRAFT_1023066, partial [Fomitopsis schrenkii]